MNYISQNPLIKSPYELTAHGEVVFLNNGKDDVIIGRVYGIGTHNPSLTMKCPRCRRDIRIGAHKGVIVQQLFPPIPRRLPWGSMVNETLRVSVTEPFQCAHPALVGKGICGYPMRIQDGNITCNQK